MVLVRTLRNKGATTVVEVNGEVLFMPGGQVHGWTRRFSNRVARFTEAYAPRNRRPRWAHYGEPLKKTIVSAPPRFRMYARGPRIYSGVGSTAPYAAFVDQGTGVYAGNGAYEARILPPWTRGGPSLYERTWVAGDSQVSPVMIKGQKGQFFFERGLVRGFQSMRMRSFQVPSDPKISQASSAASSVIEGKLSNTKDNPLFLPQLEEWRAWRDEAWNHKRFLGVRPRVGPNTRRRRAQRRLLTPEDRAVNNAARQARWRERHPDKVAEYNARRREDRRNAAISQLAEEMERERVAQEAALRKRRQQRAALDQQSRARRLAEMQRQKNIKAEKDRIREEKERENLRKRIATRKFNEARAEAYQYLHAIEAQYPDAEVQISKDRTMIRVHFNGPDGPHNVYFLRPEE